MMLFKHSIYAQKPISCKQNYDCKGSLSVCALSPGPASVCK